MGAKVSRFQDFHGWKIPTGKKCSTAKLSLTSYSAPKWKNVYYNWILLLIATNEMYLESAILAHYQDYIERLEMQLLQIKCITSNIEHRKLEHSKLSRIRGFLLLILDIC